MTSRRSILLFVGTLSWAVLGLFHVAISLGDLLSGVYDVVPRERMALAGVLAWGLMLLISAGHILAHRPPYRWAVWAAGLSAFAFLAVMIGYFIDWHVDPMEQGRNGGTVPIVAVLSLLAIASLAPLYATRRRS